MSSALNPEANHSAFLQDLKTQIVDSAILTPGTAEYAESIKRWSSGAERKAVCAYRNPCLLTYSSRMMLIESVNARLC